jgi:hypothetical protein
MASPRYEVFFAYDLATGVPLTGAAGGMSFDTYKDETGTNLSQPAITEIGGGAYKFLPTFASTSHGVVYVLNLGTGAAPARVARYARNEDFASEDGLQFQMARCKIFVSGGDANRLVVYQPDGTTPLMKFDLKDQLGAPTYSSPFERVPV